MNAVKVSHFVVSSALLLGCGSDAATPTSSGEVQIVATPKVAPRRGANSFTLTLSKGAIAPGAKQRTSVVVTPWMPSMGHGASTAPVVTEQAPGTYAVDEGTFSMAGRWELRVKVTSDVGDGSATFSYDVP